MLNFKKHPVLMILVLVFIVAWGVWTFFFVPQVGAPGIPSSNTAPVTN